MKEEIKGCGHGMYMSGTNGGMFPCGSIVDMFGERAQYFCDKCCMKLNAESMLDALYSIRNLPQETGITFEEQSFRATVLALDAINKVKSFKICLT